MKEYIIVPIVERKIIALGYAPAVRGFGGYEKWIGKKSRFHLHIDYGIINLHIDNFSSFKHPKPKHSVSKKGVIIKNELKRIIESDYINLL